MRNVFWLLLALMAVIVLISGCPRDTDTDSDPTIPEGRKPDYTAEKTPADEAPADEAAAEEAAAEEVVSEEAPADEASADEASADEVSGEEAVAEEAPADEPVVEEQEPEIIEVILETSKGDIVVAVHPEWAPIGAEHFVNLVNAGFYDGAPWFRVFKDPLGISVAQFGIAADPKVTAEWQLKTIMDEKVVKGNLRGTLAFGKSPMPNSRSTHIFVNLVDNSAALDPQGFACFGEIADGIDVADSLHETGSDAVSQHVLSQRGIEYFREVMPEGDVIEKAYVKK